MIKSLFEKQKTFFRSNTTKTLNNRIAALKSLYRLVDENEELLSEAVYDDFKKPPFETYATELGILKVEINFALNNLSNWLRPETVKGSLINFPSRNVVYKEPYGTVLIIAPWNYPIQLALLPLVGAIAAGNTAIIKPSENTPNTSACLAELIGQYFDKEFITVVEGAVEETQQLLELPFDHIFFTGSSQVGKIVMKAAAEHLTPVTLELGGKSPCIVAPDADLQMAASRIMWGKLLNAGQTCVAPDYVYVHEDQKAELIQYFNEAVTEFYGEDVKSSPDYPRIINDDHFERLKQILVEDSDYLVSGGDSDASQRYIEPSILDIPDWNANCMKDEIFGPILPVLGYNELEMVIDTVNSNPKPLACYLFTEEKQTESRIIQGISFGGGAVNDTVAHLGNHHLPFGGVGNSGMGSYHGKGSFDTFSHSKSIMKKSTWPKIPIRYAPYGDNIKWLKRFLR